MTLKGGLTGAVYNICVGVYLFVSVVVRMCVWFVRVWVGVCMRVCVCVCVCVCARARARRRACVYVMWCVCRVVVV